MMTINQRRRLRHAQAPHGNRILAACHILGISQRTLAERSGLGRTAVTHLAAGRRRPRVATARRLAVAIGVRIEDLFPFDPFATAPAPPAQEVTP